MVKFQDKALDRTFAALADPTRRALMARLGEQDNLSVSELARPFPVSLPAIVPAAHARCLSVHPWTIDPPSLMTTLIAQGVDGMFTNVPDKLDGVLGKAAGRGRQVARRAAALHRKCVKALGR